ncbi:MAG: hypothetical protein HKO66_08925 [Saprospiraceae bacterium]|nr:hypothetical protein [Bacteroidia bacterium]NNE13495.1 hypothetical protein [Saprospiraceae bacterium]NNL92339.1 hypothetical protein [Saprospiraceae bacterium]
MRNVSKHVGFVLLLALLAMLYIANAHKGERKLRRIAKLKKEVESAKSDYQEIKSSNTYSTTESQLKKKLESQGLKINSEAPILIDSEN